MAGQQPLPDASETAELVGEVPAELLVGQHQPVQRRRDVWWRLTQWTQRPDGDSSSPGNPGADLASALGEAAGCLTRDRLNAALHPPRPVACALGLITHAPGTASRFDSTLTASCRAGRYACPTGPTCAQQDPGARGVVSVARGGPAPRRKVVDRSGVAAIADPGGEAGSPRRTRRSSPGSRGPCWRRRSPRSRLPRTGGSPRRDLRCPTRR